MTKPVDLIVANVLHECAAKREKLPAPLRKLLDSSKPEIRNIALARDLLHNIILEADETRLLKLLSAVGAAASLAEIGQRYEAVLEQRGPLPEPPQADNSPSADGSGAEALMRYIADRLQDALGPGVTVSDPIKVKG